MFEVTLENLPKHIEEATVQVWFFEEGDPVNEGDDLVELTTEDGKVTIQAGVTGILAEVYYDEGEVVAKGEMLCTIDNDANSDDDDEEDEDSDEEKDEDEEDDE